MALSPKRQRFYVYGLKDPRTGELFYIGKGTGNRCTDHVREWRAGVVGNPDKYARIGQIIEQGVEPPILIIRDGLSEQGAYRLERQAIAAIGIDNLTNQKPGTIPTAEAARKRAAILLTNVKPFPQWLSEQSRSPSDIDLYHFVAHGLQEMAHA